MIEIFKDTNYDFLGKKKYFIAFSLIISLLGFISFFTKGFNLGIDFSGGTIVTVRFKKPHDDSRLRAALGKNKIDVNKVIIQPIGAEIGQTPKNDVLIRLPQTAAEVQGDADADKKAIIAVLNANYSDIPAAEKQNKVDINNAGAETIKQTLMARGPLGATPEAEQEYARLADYIVKYRSDQSIGLISDVSQIPLGGFDPRFATTLKDNFYAGDFNIIDAAAVGPQVGRELRNRAIYVTLAALAGMLVYIAFRFEWIYGVGAIVATFHDVIVTLAFFSLFGWEISLNVIAALLTLIGYSMNDTIVIYDRIREMLRLKRREDIEKVSNEAINQTLSRTVITSGLTFMSVCALVLFGGPVLKGFSLTLFIGILIGTYSSIAIATPIMLWWKDVTGHRLAEPLRGDKGGEKAAAGKPTSSGSKPTPRTPKAPKPKSGGTNTKATNAKA